MADNFLNLTGLTRFKQKLDALFGTKQDTLVSGTNIKTINNTSLLGGGNIDIEGGGSDIFYAYSSGPNKTTYNEIYNLPSNTLIILNDRFLSTYRESYEDFIQLSIISSDRFVTIASIDSSDDWNVDDTHFLLTNGDDVLQTYILSDVADFWNPRTSDHINFIPNNNGLEVSTYDKNHSTYFQKFLADKTYVDDTIAKEATETVAGTVKLNPNESVDLNANGQLTVGGRLGQFPNGGVFYPTTIEPTNVGGSTFMMTDGAKNLSLAGRTFGIMAGANLTCKSASAGATEYRVSNTQSNRFALFAAKGGRAAIDQTDATNNGTALITSIKFANGNDISAYYGPTESSNDIIITLERTVNPSAATTKLRVYGTSTSSDVIVVGQGCGAAGGKAISLGQSCFVGGNQCIAFGNGSIVTGNNSVAFGHTHLVNKQFCFAAGQGHDFTNAGNGTGAVGIASEIGSNTAFAVGNGVFNANGNITRSNAFEVLKDGSIVLKSPDGSRFKIAVDNSGNISATKI